MVAFGAATGAALIVLYKSMQGGTSDFGYWWTAGRAILAGSNPYTAVHPGVRVEMDNWFVYPLPTALVSVPFALTPFTVGAALFGAVGVGVLAWALTKDNWDRWPILLSFPTLWAISSSQWSLFVTAAALLPALGFLGACKPTLGAAAWLYRPTSRYIVTGLAICGLAFIVIPDWPLQWIASTRRSVSGNYHIPVLVPGGFVLLAAALRWKRPEARLLLAMSLIPQSMFPYDQLALGLVPRTRIQAYLWSIWTYLAVWLPWFVFGGRHVEGKAPSLQFLAYVVTYGYYAPLLVEVLRRRNEPVVNPISGEVA